MSTSADMDFLSQKRILVKRGLLKKGLPSDRNTNNLVREKYDIMMCKGKERRCDVCTKTYKWKWDLPPIEYDEMAVNVEEMNRKLTCSIFCYLVKTGKFIINLPKRKVQRTVSTSATVYGADIWHRIKDDDASEYNLAYTKMDQEHYQE